MNRVSVIKHLRPDFLYPHFSVRLDDKEVFSFSFELLEKVRHYTQNNDEMFDELILGFMHRHPEILVKEAFRQMREAWQHENEIQRREDFFLYEK